MGETLIMADQMEAYVLTDHGTYLNFKKKIRLVPLISASMDLMNPYGVIVVNPDKHTTLRADLAIAFVDFIISRQAQQMIRDYRVEGEQLFHPMRLPNND